MRFSAFLDAAITFGNRVERYIPKGARAGRKGPEPGRGGMSVNKYVL